MLFILFILFILYCLYWFCLFACLLFTHAWLFSARASISPQAERLPPRLRCPAGTRRHPPWQQVLATGSKFLQQQQQVAVASLLACVRATCRDRTGEPDQEQISETYSPIYFYFILVSLFSCLFVVSRSRVPSLCGEPVS